MRITLALMLGMALGGCQLVADFDRSKIEEDAGTSMSDSGVMPDSGAMSDASVDSGDEDAGDDEDAGS